MKSGIIRRVDDLGRILIPKEIRRTLQIREGDPLEISVEEGKIVIEPYIATGDYRTAIKRIVDNIKQDSTYTEDEKRRASFVVAQLESVIESLDKEDNNEMADVLNTGFNIPPCEIGDTVYEVFENGARKRAVYDFTYDGKIFRARFDPGSQFAYEFGRDIFFNKKDALAEWERRFG